MTEAKLKGPKFVRFFGPVIHAIKELGGSGTPSEVIEIVARSEKISEAAQQETTSSGGLRFANQVHFARQYLVWAGLLAWRAFAQRPLIKRIANGAVILFVLIGFCSAGLRSDVVYKTIIPKRTMTHYQIGKDRVWLPPADAKYCDNVKQLIAKYVKPDEPILFAPLLTTFYCLLDKESPVYDLYFAIAVPRWVEERMVLQLEQKKVKWAILGNIFVDGNSDHTMSRSHPLLWQYLLNHFEVVTREGLRPAYCLMRRKSNE